MSNITNDASDLKTGLLGVGAIAVFLVGMLAGWAIVTWQRDTTKEQLASHQIASARADAATAEAGRARLQAAVDRNNVLEKALAESQATLHQLSEDQRNAVKKYTTGRACLGAGALRVLNATEGSPVDGMSATIGNAPAASGAATTDPDVEGEEAIATDVDVSGWAITVKEQYGVCRDRLQRLIDWFNPVTSTVSKPEEHDD